MTAITWDNANFTYDNNPHTWDEIILARRAAGEDWNLWEQKDKDKLVKLILKVHGNTITESKRKKIKQYKIKASDIKITVEKVLGVEVLTENIKF
tara:strand:+ start:1029 stop:1313 length:285 start_codon:yes stop_codon:yes gene_type:complete